MLKLFMYQFMHLKGMIQPVPRPEYDTILIFSKILHNISCIVCRLGIEFLGLEILIAMFFSNSMIKNVPVGERLMVS